MCCTQVYYSHDDLTCCAVSQQFVKCIQYHINCIFQHYICHATHVKGKKGTKKLCLSFTVNEQDRECENADMSVKGPEMWT